MKIIYWLIYKITTKKPVRLKLRPAKQHEIVWDGIYEEFQRCPYDHERPLWVVEKRKNRFYKIHNWAWGKLNEYD